MTVAVNRSRIDCSMIGVNDADKTRPFRIFLQKIGEIMFFDYSVNKCLYIYSGTDNIYCDFTVLATCFDPLMNRLDGKTHVFTHDLLKAVS